MSVFPPSEAFNPCIEGCKCEEDDRQIINGRTTNVYIYCWRGASVLFIILFAYVISQ